MKYQKNSSKEKFGFSKNFLFSMCALLDWDPIMLLLEGFYVVSSVFGTYIGIKLPAQLILCVNESTNVYDFLSSLAKNIFLFLICNVICMGSKQYIYRNSGTLTLYFSKNIFNKLMRVPYETLEYRNVHKLWGNVWNVLRNDYIIRNYILSIPETLIAIIGTIWFGYLVGKESILMLVFASITCVLSLFTMSSVKDRHQKYHADINAKARKTSYISNISMDPTVGKDIRIFAIKKWLIREYDETLNELDGIYKKIHNIFFVRKLFDSGMLMITEIFCYLYFTYQVIAANISVAEFVLLIGVFRQFLGYLSSVFSQLQTLITSNTSISYLCQFMKIPEEKLNQEALEMTPTDTTYRGMKIEFRNVSYHYPGNKEEILKDINFTIGENENIALIGLNGAGKTTLVKLMCGFYKPTKGVIQLNDIPLEEYGESAKKFFAVLFQDSEILPLSVDENIKGSISNITDDRLLWALKLSGFQKKYNDFEKKGKTLLVKSVNVNASDMSGGEKQKLLFTRALYKNKPVLILDEPTAALDPIAEKELYYKYAEATKDRTSIFISHRLSSTKFCDKIILLNEGQIAESGSHMELMEKKGLYYQLYKTQSKYYVEK